jgi:hypothetical protein
MEVATKVQSTSCQRQTENGKVVGISAAGMQVKKVKSRPAAPG